MTKQEFKKLWEANESGSGITFDDMADCAVSWGVCNTPRIRPIHVVRYIVLKAAETSDCEDYKPK